MVHGRNAGGGASMRMWSDYFPRGNIYGIDVNPAGYLDDDRITTAVVDQGDRDALEAFIESLDGVLFDAIVDDGSHRPDHQQVSLSTLFQYLKPGGLYFIEDLLDNGKGDPNRGRFSATSVLNTRSILRSFAESGTFREPNALCNATELAETIEWVHFHAPSIKILQRPRPDADSGSTAVARQRTRPTIGYIEGEEKLCVIRRRPA
jgi:hypothetical protein